MKITSISRMLPEQLKRHALSVSVFILLCLIATAMFYPLFDTGAPLVSVDLSGEWKISLDDSPEFANPSYDDSAWDTITLPGKIVPYTAAKTGKIRGICWIRKRVAIPPAEGDFGLILGRIANADQTYVNGVKVGETGRFPPNLLAMWNVPRCYDLPEGIVESGGENIIAARIAFDVTGDVTGRLEITDGDYLKSHAPLTRFLNVTVGYATIAIGFVLTVAFLFSRLGRLEFNEEYLYFLQFFVGLPIVLELCLTWPVYPDHMTRLKVLGLSWVAVNVVHPMFLHRLYRLNRGPAELILVAYFFICLAGSIFFTNKDNIRFMGALLIFWTWLIGFYNISCHVEAIVRKREFAKSFSIFGIITVLTAMNDGIVYFNKFVDFDVSLFGWTPTMMLIQFGGIFLFVGTFLVLEARYRQMTQEIEELNSDLESFIIENTRLARQVEESRQKKNREISESAERKILAAMEIIEENYLSGLSRAELARKVGVHPDSLGKQFKQYTGKKLSEYIYELRIKEAARRLRETDEKVINIALDVGFESLRTFNRVFPRYMGDTPAKYREKHRSKKRD